MCNYEIQFETEANGHKNEETVVWYEYIQISVHPTNSSSVVAGMRKRNRRHTESRCQADSYGERVVSAFSHDRVIQSLLSAMCMWHKN